ncbi:anti-sigma-D factor RsdA [Mycolicibacterium sp. XJ870]
MPDFGRWTANGGDPSLNEINRTDRFIEALSLERPVYSTDPEEAELAYLLAGWRDDARQAPMSGILTPHEAVAALDRATPRNRTHFPMAVVGSVAAAMLCLGGFGAAVYGAGPGDALYGVRSVLFGDQIKRDVQVELASNELQQVQQLIDQGQWQEAQEKLQTLTTTVATVDDTAQKQELVDQWQQLSVKVENRDANATVPPDAPPVVLPEVTVTTSPATETTAPPTSDSATPPSETTPTTVPSETPTSSPSATPPTTPATTPPSETTAPATTAPATTVPATTSPAPTSSNPAVELPPPAEVPTETPTTPAPVVTSEPVTETTVAPPADTTTTVLPDVTIPTEAETEPEEGGRGGGGQGGGGQQKEPELPVIELPLLPGLGGGGQR